MLITLIISSWILSATFMFLNHPLSFGFILLLQTIIVAVTTGVQNLDYWFSYILFLIMIGGMLVLFIYMTSVASNEKFKFSNKLFIFFMITSIFLSMTILADNFLTLMNTASYDLTNQSVDNLNMSLHKYLNYPNMLTMIMLFIYLLVTLIAVVKITKSKMGPLRQMF